MKAAIQHNNFIIINGLYPGVGKTTAVKNCGLKVLFITPYNKLAQELRKENFTAITLHHLLRMGITGTRMKHIKTYDISKFEAVCFDEVYLYNPFLLSKIHRYMQNNNSVHFIATGDLDQLEPIGLENQNVKNAKEYLGKCVDILFPNKIILKENKRLKNDTDKQKLKDLKTDIFNHSLKLYDVFRKHGITMTSDSAKDITTNTRKNICYFNFRAKMINGKVHKTVNNHPSSVNIDGTEYFKGLELICKKSYKGSKGIRLYTNYTYEITEFNEKEFSIREPVDNDRFKFPIKMLSHFSLPYCMTVHSVQGLSINEPITIFDSNTPYVDRHFVWTALTRATNLNNVTIFMHSHEKNSRFENSKIKQYFKIKIQGYKSQDKKANREFKEENYITVDWIY